ncbi:Cytochrome b5 [Rhynchospora pubera]|uniref:Cytochrome b5 n=1 Tax=Rhynchospora pubera TaxID=906938 RepID=A0AAV8DKM7_9POAL|nr:Cytochrome b5 [Rhynchospora pubera]
MGDLKKLSASEISLHTSKDDCWLLINGKVYDVTKFLEDHPGGEEVLLHASASGDATDAFENVGHSTSATSMMESYLIGSVEGYVAPYAATGEASSRPTSSAQGNKGPASSSASFVDYLLPVLVLIFAFVAWYYLTFVHTDEKK